MLLIGNVTCNGKIYKGKQSALITRELWDKVHAKRKEVEAKVKTLIENETLTVASWSRAGHRASRKRKQMGVSRFFIEAVAKAVEGIEASEKHLKWADSIREKQTSPFRYRELVGTEGLGPPTLSV